VTKKPASTSPRPGSRAALALAEAAEDQRLATLPIDARARALVARFGVFEEPITSEAAVKRLVAMGAAAVPALVAHLDAPHTGWQAAFTLAHIGEPGAVEAAPALRFHASHQPDTPASMWSTQALARLGLLDEVAALLQSPAKAHNVAHALAAVTPVSFPWIERALDLGDPEIDAPMADALGPGRGRFFDPAPDGFAATVGGCRSPHAIVRMAAVLLLWSPTYPRATRPLALAELLRLTADASSEVRRLTALSLGRVGKAAAPVALAALAPMLDDPEANVRSTARSAARSLGGASG
jgi:HEAT repeat protein